MSLKNFYFASEMCFSDSDFCRRKPRFPGSLADLHRFRKTVHGHDGSSRIVMVRKTDQRTFASKEKGQEPKLETITRETIETFRGQRTECKITTEKKGCEEKFPNDLIESLNDKIHRTPSRTLLKKKLNPIMDFQSECLRAHNEYRKRHGVPPLKLDKEMCRTAQQWANHLINRHGLQHSNNRDFGENLFGMTSSNPNFTVSGKEPVEAWYEEIKDHTFGIEPTSLASGHFTQVVWKESAKLGVAFAKSGGKVVVVANYDPPGNIIGHFSKNVPPLGGYAENNNRNDYTDSFSKLSISNGTLNKLNRSSSKDLKSGTEGSFEEDFLKSHNEYRKRHGVPPLKLDKKLCRYSEEWARHLAAKNILEHRPSCNYGENIYCMTSSDPSFTISGHNPVDVWYEEVQHHPFGREPNSLKSGHFTQVVWKESEELGVGVAKNTQGSIYVVANYKPAGNFIGHYVENVPPPLNKLANLESDKKVSFSRDVKNDGFNQFALDGLKVHNEYRRKHGAPDLILNKEMCRYAQEWADTCAKTGSMCHRANNSYGENIFCVYSSDYTHIPTARDAIKEWYDEVKKHTFGVETVNHGTLHFTQIIWKSSTDLGFAMAKNSKGETYVVANYNPRGNCVGQFLPNVPRPRF